MTGGTRHPVFTGEGAVLSVYVAVKERRAEANQTVLLLGLYLEGEGLWTDNGGSRLGVEAYNGGASLVLAFTAQGTNGWLAQDLEVTVNHDEEGSALRVPIVWSFGCAALGRPGGTLYVDLEALDWASQPAVSAKKCALGESISIQTGRVRPDLTHTLTYALGGAEGVIAQDVEDSFTWTLPEELADHMPTRQETCVITCQTFRGGTSLGSKTCSFLLQVGRVGAITAQEGWYTLTPHSSSAVADGWGVYLADRSQVWATVDAGKLKAGRGAKIQSIFMTVNGRQYLEPWHSGTLMGTVDRAVTLVVKDTRGTIHQRQEELTVLPYSPPTVYGAQCYRCTADGTGDDGGNYVAVLGTPVFASVGGRNSASMTLKLCTPAGQVLQTVTAENGGVYGGSLDAQTSYRAVLEVRDAVGETGSVAFTLPAQTVAFQIRAGGDGAAFGGPATEPECLAVYWSGLKVGGEPVADFPVETGSDGTWTWRKWRSGFAECWGTVTGTSAEPTAWGSVYATGQQLYARYPFSFTQAPRVQVTPVFNGSRNFWVATCDGTGSAEQTPSYQLMRADSYTIDYRLDFYCAGRWR